jgi:hypothetical protein
VKNNGVTLYAKDALLFFFTNIFDVAQVVIIHHHEV